MARGGNPYGRLSNYFDVLQAIQIGPPPALPADEHSPAFCDFVAACLRKDPSDRPSAAQLLQVTSVDQR